MSLSLSPSGWWTYASSAAQIGLEEAMSNHGPNVPSDAGMIIDTGGDEEDDAKAATPSIRRMKTAVEFIQPLIRFTSNQVCKTLEANNSSGKLSNECTDLKEGLKYFTHALSTHIKTKLKEDPIVKATTELGGGALEVETFMANSDLGS